MAELAPKARASYEAAQTTERLPFQATITGLRARLRIIPLLNGCVEGIHVHVDDFADTHTVTIFSRALVLRFALAL